jgi:hypothetical protein
VTAPPCTRGSQSKRAAAGRRCVAVVSHSGERADTAAAAAAVIDCRWRHMHGRRRLCTVIAVLLSVCR